MKKIKLGDVCKKIGSGATPRGGEKNYIENGISFIRSKNVQNFYFDYENLAFISEEQATQLSNVEIFPNDILFNITGDSIARCCLVPENILPARVSQHVSIIRCRKNFNSQYIMYYLQYLKNYLLSICKIGGTRNALTKEMLENLQINIPNSQNKIAAMLSAMDEKISLNKKINATLEEMAKTIYNYYFVQFDFPDENGKPYKSSGGKMIFSPELQREIPEGWEVKKLSDLLIKNSIPFDYKTTEPTIDLSVMPSNSISLDKLNSSDNFSTNLFKMSEGDILFGSIRPYLKKAGIAPCNGVVAGTIHSYKTKNNFDYNFSLITLCNDNFFDYAVKISTGTKMPVVSNENILEFKVAYSEKIIKMFNSIDLRKIICKNNLENNLLERLRDFLLPLLMNGQVGFKTGYEKSS